MSRRVIPLRLMVVLGALSAFGPLSMDLYLPALPQLARDLASTPAAAQLTMSTCMVGLAVGQLALGPISDRYGRRRPLLIGVAIYAATSLLCAVAPSMTALVGLRLVQGLAGGAGIVIARAIVRDLYETDAAAHVFSLLMLVTGVAPVVAPVAGGWLLEITAWPGLFVTLSVVGCVLLAASAWVIKESLPASRRETGGWRAAGRHFAAVGRDPRFLGFTAVLALGSSVLFAYISMSPFVLQSRYYGLTAQQFSYVFASNAVGLVLAGRLGAWLVGRVGPTATLRFGLLAGLVASAGLVGATVVGLGLPVVLPVLWVAVSSVALVMPNATALGLDAHRARAGTASGVMGLAQFGLSGAVAPIVSVGGTSPLLMAVTMTSAAVLAILVALLVGRPHPSPAAIPESDQAHSLDR